MNLILMNCICTVFQYSTVSTCKTCVWPLMMLLTADTEHHKVKGDVSAAPKWTKAVTAGLSLPSVVWIWGSAAEDHDHLSVSRYKRLRSVWDCLSSWEEEGQPAPLGELVGSTLENIREADGETLLQSAEFWVQCQWSLRTSRTNAVKHQLMISLCCFTSPHTSTMVRYLAQY